MPPLTRNMTPALVASCLAAAAACAVRMTPPSGCSRALALWGGSCSSLYVLLTSEADSRELGTPTAAQDSCSGMEALKAVEECVEGG